MWIAADGQQEDLVAILLQMLQNCPQSSWPDSAPSPDGTAAFEIATAHGHDKIMKMLLDSNIFGVDDVQQVCKKFGRLKFLQDNFGTSPLITMSHDFPQFNEKTVEGPGVKIASG